MKDYFSSDNFHNWVRPVAFEAWMLWFREAVRDSEAGSRPSSRMSLYTSTPSISRLVPFHTYSLYPFKFESFYYY